MDYKIVVLILQLLYLIMPSQASTLISPNNLFSPNEMTEVGSNPLVAEKGLQPFNFAQAFTFNFISNPEQAPPIMPSEHDQTSKLVQESLSESTMKKNESEDERKEYAIKEVSLQKGKRLLEFESLIQGTSFEIKFKIIVNSFEFGDYVNVFHVTNGGDCCEKGQRIPALWVHRNKFLHFCNVFNGEGNYGINFDITPGTQYDVIIKQLPYQDQKLMYQIIIDGKTIFKEENKTPGIAKNVKFYASDPWFESFQNYGKLTDFTVVV